MALNPKLMYLHIGNDLIELLDSAYSDYCDFDGVRFGDLYLRYFSLIYTATHYYKCSVWRYPDGHHVLLESDTELSGAINIHKVHFD